MSSKTKSPEAAAVSLAKQNLIQHELQLKALIQDIVNCTQHLDELNELNNLGRVKLNELRKDIDLLDNHAKELGDPILISEVESYRQQFASSIIAFKNANLKSSFAIETSQRNNLMGEPENSSEVRQRKTTDKSALFKMSSGVTDQLFSISRHLADTTQRSANTLDDLVNSSSSVKSTREELENTAGTISQSGKLLNKYSRREFTDKLLIFFAFLFFIACVLYILQKRLF